MNIDEWAASVVGRYIDRDYFPKEQPAQCHDIWLDYLNRVLGGATGLGWAPGEGWTDEVWKQFPAKSGLENYVTKIGGTNIQKGDVVFFAKGSGSYPLSHVVVAMSPTTGGSVDCITQNPGATKRATITLNGCLGVLRPKVAVVPLAPDERQVRSDSPANRRATPDRTHAPIPEQLAVGEKGKFKGWVYGENVDGNNIWFVGYYSGNYFWSGCFTDTGVHDLADLNVAAPSPTPVIPAPVLPASATLKPLCDNIAEWNATAEDIAKFNYVTQPVVEDMPLPDWITERHVEPGLNGYKVGRPGQPNHAVYHHAWAASIDGAVATLSGKTDAPTANYVIKDSEVVSMVNEGDSPFTNGRIGSNIWALTWELVNDKQTGVDANGKPVFSAPSRQTLETAAWVTARAMIRRGWKTPIEKDVNAFGHGQVSKTPTSCPGDTDIAYIVKRANEIVAEYRKAQEAVKPVEPTKPVEEEKPMPEPTKEELEQILAQQQQIMGQLKPVDLGNIITDNKVRKVVWAIYGIAGLFLVAGIGGLTAIRAIGPEWFIFTVGAYAALGPAFSSLAIANISTKK